MVLIGVMKITQWFKLELWETLVRVPPLPFHKCKSLRSIPTHKPEIGIASTSYASRVKGALPDTQ